jgi:hypothetical protein
MHTSPDPWVSTCQPSDVGAVRRAIGVNEAAAAIRVVAVQAGLVRFEEQAVAESAKVGQRVAG